MAGPADGVPLSNPCRGVDSMPIGEPQPDMAAGDPAFELVGGALGDQSALIEYGDAVGQFVGLLEVLGGAC